jgi:hypothetical protein
MASLRSYALFGEAPVNSVARGWQGRRFFFVALPKIFILRKFADGVSRCMAKILGWKDLRAKYCKTKTSVWADGLSRDEVGEG